jgi:hypothetical protein
MTLRNIVKSAPVLQKLTTQELSVVQLYCASKLVKAVNEELAIYNAGRRELIERHCEKDGDKLKYKDGTGEAFNRELQELLDVEVELKVKPLVLTERDNIRLTLCDMDAVEGLVKIKIGEEE